jgi:hypothetical protein
MPRHLILVTVSPLVLIAAEVVSLGSAPASEPPLPELEDVVTDHFATSQRCALCHSNAPQADGLRDADGGGVAPFDLWQSTMMANSARDPLWRAAVSVEMAATPSLATAIQAKCFRCHAPMGSHQALRTKQGPIGLATLRGEGEVTQLTLDGVSCTACHQILPDNLGKASSYSGNYRVGTERQIFGPHADPIGMPMVRHSGFTPVQGDHVRQSALCATCHTLFTTAFDAGGKPTGQRLPEQTPYLEWRNSVFNDEIEDVDLRAQSCQDCHAPITDELGRAITTRIARNPMGGDFLIDAREPLGRHIFVGGNTLIPAILRDNAETLKPQASRAAFDATIARAKAQLQQRTARVWLGEGSLEGGRLQVPIRVENLAGHKLPTGHPTRRAWLRVRVRDAAGNVLFATGEHDDAGRIVSVQGQPLPQELRGGPLYPHRTQIDAPGQVQVYESVMGDAEGAPTYLLMRGGHYLKDNRLLPLGWRPDHDEAKDTAPQGLGDDADFLGGSDQLQLAIPVPANAAEVEVEASLIYQVLGARYAAELLAWDTPEVKAFQGYYERADRRPVEAASARRRIQRSR